MLCPALGENAAGVMGIWYPGLVEDYIINKMTPNFMGLSYVTVTPIVMHGSILCAIFYAGSFLLLIKFRRPIVLWILLM